MKVSACLILFLASAAAQDSTSIQCPAPMFRTVEVECWFLGESVPCNRSQPVGTKATFTCAPHHHFLYDFLPPSGVQSKCKEDGKWSVNPFRCVPVCGQPTGKSPVLVNNGDTVNSAAQFPWHVSVYEVQPQMKQICGGSLISTKYFVSAAHCFYGKTGRLPERNFKAALGKTKRDYDAQEDEEYSQKTDLLHIHVRKYGKKKFNYVNDIALVELAEEVTITAYVMPVCIDWTRDQPLLRDGDEGTVAGYGGYKEPSKDLQFGKMPYVSEEKCRTNINSRLAVYTQMRDKFCAGVSPDKGTDVAKGDSGGGLAFKTQTESYYLYGVVSVGLPGFSNISFFTNVSIFIPWMSGIIAKAEVSGKRCGLDLTETDIVDNEDMEENSVPWILEIGFLQNGTGRYTRLWHGILLEPNLVLTKQRSDRERQSLTYGDCEACGITEIPASWLRVLSLRDEESYFYRLMGFHDWTESYFNSSHRYKNAAFIRKVRRVHDSLDAWFQFGTSYNLVLLELESPLNVMPACIDLTDSAAVAQQPRGTMVFFGVKERKIGKTEKRHYPYPYWGVLDIESSAVCQNRSSPNVDYYHICTKNKPEATGLFPGTTDQHPEWTPFSGALMVSIDNTWYLRGVAQWSWSGTLNTIVYTDLADKDVKSWILKTKDSINKPSCGNVNLCKELDSDESLNGHLPWDVRVSIEGVQDMFPGVLIHPRAILTDANNIIEVYSQMVNDTKIKTVPPASLVTIHWGDQDKGDQSTKVLTIHIHKVNYKKRSLSLSRDIALLEATSQMEAEPICLDLTGQVLVPLQNRQTGVVETAKNWTSFWNKLTGAAFASNLKCLQLLEEKQVVGDKRPHSNCAGPIGEEAPAGTAYIVSSEKRWYLRGVSSGVLNKKRPYLFGFTDLRNTDIRSWIGDIYSRLKTDANVLDKPPLQTCVGNRVSYENKNKCGLFALDPDDAASAARIAMPWMLQVVTSESDYVFEERPGYLIRADLVITPSTDNWDLSIMYNKKLPKDWTKMWIPDASKTEVKWASLDKRGDQRTKVRRVHSYYKDAGPSDYWGCSYGEVLLELQSPIPLTPVCVPRAVWGIPALQPNQTGMVGKGRSTYVAGVASLSHINKCAENYQNASEQAALNCTNRSKHPLCADYAGLTMEIRYDYVDKGAFFTQHDGSWYIRAFGQRTRNPNDEALVVFSNKEFLSWLETKMDGHFPEPLKIPVTENSTAQHPFGI